VSYDVDDMNDISKVLGNRISELGYSPDYVITASDVVSAICKLKWNKNDGCAGLSTNHLKYATPELFVHISCLFSAIVVHGSVPNDFLSSTAVPIPKGRNVNLTDSTNYRGISLSSVLGKLFDLIVLCRYSDYLESCELQFGFKPKRSTAMCSMILKEAISYYSHNNSSVFCVFLDATKAFDRVNYCKLFRLLMERNMPPHVVRVLMNIYTGRQVRVC